MIGQSRLGAGPLVWSPVGRRRRKRSFRDASDDDFAVGPDRGETRRQPPRPRQHERGTAAGGNVAVRERRPAEGRALAGEDRLHRRVQGSRRRSSPGAQAQRRRRRSRRSRRARRRAARRVRLPDRLLSVLGARARTKRLRLRAVRRELHHRGTERRRSVHRRPLPDRHRRLRSHATSRHLLPRRHSHERPAHSRPARLPSPAGLLLPRAPRGRGPGGRRDPQARLGPGTDDGRRGRRAALPPRTPASAAAPSAADPCPQPGLASLLPRPARRRIRERQRRSGNDQPASGLARFPPTDRDRNRARVRLRDLHPARRPGRGAAPPRASRPVPHAANPTRERSRGRCFGTTPSRDRPMPATTGSLSSANTPASPVAICIPGSGSAPSSRSPHLEARSSSTRPTRRYC